MLLTKLSLVLLQDAVRFLAPSGAQVSLRYEVRYPLAVWFAQQAALAAAGPYGMIGVGSIHSSSSSHGHHHAASAASALERGLKRFEICRVQRAGRGGRGLPASYLQADFDLISPGAAGGGVKERMLAEAEVIKVAAQVRELKGIGIAIQPVLLYGRATKCALPAPCAVPAGPALLLSD
jgi:histidyl-tRNA synthetase